MNTLTKEELEDFISFIGAAHYALNSACEILAKNHIDTPLGLQMELASGQACDLVSNALFSAKEEQNRLMKEAAEDKA